jgi:T5SS/PEP-CTERM-associated repeat protein
MAGATVGDFRAASIPVSDVYSLYTPTELYASGAGYSYSQIIGASPGTDFAAIKAAGATASDFYNALTPIGAVYSIYTPTELHAAGAGYTYNDIIGASPGTDFAAIKDASATAEDFNLAGVPVSGVYSLYTPTELQGGGYSYGDIIGASDGTDYSAIKDAGATAGDFNLAGVPVSGVYSLYTPAELHAADYFENLYVGNNSSGVTTNFTSGTNPYDNTYVGYTPDSSNNTLNVSGAGTLLTNYTDIYVGYEGSSNNLTIADGGTVASVDGFIGSDAAASNNSVLVTGANSLWTNSNEL